MNLLNSLSQVNFLAVVVAGVCHMAVGLVWFQPSLFGRAWAALTKQELKPAVRWLVPGFFGHLLIALALAMLIVVTDATIPGALLIGVFVWLSFVVTLELGELIWEKIPVKLFLIRIGNHLVALCVACLILGVWR
jgi:hypothetical protein